MGRPRAVLLVGEVGPFLELPQWAIDASPFAHVPPLPGTELGAAPLLSLTAIAAALTATGLLAINRRDIE